MAAPHSSTLPEPKIVLGRDKFRLLAAIAPLIWALWHKQWRWSVFLLVLSLIMGGFSLMEGSVLLLANAIGVAINIWYGFEAEALRQADYHRLGYTDLGPIWAVDVEHAYVQALGRLDSPPASQT